MKLYGILLTSVWFLVLSNHGVISSEPILANGYKTSYSQESYNGNEFCEKDDPICRRDYLAYQAISELHSQLDDDKDGEVDPLEADEFVRDELKYTDDFERTKALHRHDKYISKLELWNSWKRSEAFNWTTDEVIHWLVNHVKLPNYVEHFQALQVRGSDLPKLAGNNMSYLSAQLGIKNPVDKQKLHLKAMDLILFGPPSYMHSPWKDLVVLITIFLLAGGFWYAMIQNRCSKLQIARMNHELEVLLSAESSLKDLQAKLEKGDEDSSFHKDFSNCFKSVELAKREAERIHNERRQASEDSERLRLAEEELNYLQELLKEKENLLIVQQEEIQRLTQQMLNGSQGNMNMFNSGELQLMLQLCCERERHHLSNKRAAVNTQALLVKEEHQKLTKKKSGFVGSFRVDISGNMEQLESRISQVNDAVKEVKQDYLEYQHRWSQVEELLNIKILDYSSGLTRVSSNLQELDNSPSSSSLQTNSSRVNLYRSTAINNSSSSNVNSTIPSRPISLMSRPISSANLPLWNTNSNFKKVTKPNSTATTPGQGDYHSMDGFTITASVSTAAASTTAATNGGDDDEFVIGENISIGAASFNSMENRGHHLEESSSNSNTAASRRDSPLLLLNNNSKVSSGNKVGSLNFVQPFAYRWKKRTDLAKKK